MGNGGNLGNLCPKRGQVSWHNLLVLSTGQNCLISDKQAGGILEKQSICSAGLEEGKGLRSEKCSQKLVDDLRGFASVLRLSQKVLNEGEGLLNDTKEYYSSGAIERNLYLGVLLYVMIRRCAVPITLYEIASCVGRNYRDLSRKYRYAENLCIN